MSVTSQEFSSTDDVSGVAVSSPDWLGVMLALLGVVSSVTVVSVSSPVKFGSGFFSFAMAMDN